MGRGQLQAKQPRGVAAPHPASIRVETIPHAQPEYDFVDIVFFQALTDTAHDDPPGGRPEQTDKAARGSGWIREWTKPVVRVGRHAPPRNEDYSPQLYSPWSVHDKPAHGES